MKNRILAALIERNQSSQRNASFGMLAMLLLSASAAQGGTYYERPPTLTCKTTVYPTMSQSAIQSAIYAAGDNSVVCFAPGFSRLSSGFWTNAGQSLYGRADANGFPSSFLGSNPIYRPEDHSS